MTTSVTETVQTGSIPLSTTAQLDLSGPTTAKLNFFEPPADGSAPFNYVEDPPEGMPKFNFGTTTHSYEINDMRGRESTFSIDKHAFLPLPAAATAKARGNRPEADFTSDESVRERYYPEVERILLSALPGMPKRVVIFDHTVRRAAKGAAREPVLRVHIDQTPASAAERVRVHLPPAEAEELLRGRYRLVNVWRPLNGAVESSPLAVADSSTVPDEALVAVEHRYPHRTGQTAGVLPVDSMRWYSWSGMDNDERLLLQCFDSESGSRVPHTAFVDPRSPPDAKPRESIEVRALIFG